MCRPHAGACQDSRNQTCPQSVCLCLPPTLRLVITSGVIWTPYDWLKRFYSFCMAAIISIVSRHGLRNEVLCRNQHNKSKLALYKPLLDFYSQLYISNKTECFSYKCGCGVHELTCIEAFKRRAGLGSR